MTPQLRRLIVEKYTGWSETWGVSFVFAVTQSVEEAERIIADAVVAVVAVETPGAVRFAATLWEISKERAYRGFGSEVFFKMPALTRAIVILKVKAQFSRQQIAEALQIKLKQVDDHLENARLLFSSGKSWIEASPGVRIEGDTWKPDCDHWSATAPRSEEENGQDIQDVFAQYIGNDLDADTNRQLHSHFTSCQTCRTSLSHFKKQYTDWMCSLPLVEPDQELKKHITKVTRMALKINRRQPRAWPAVRKVLQKDGQARAILFGILSLLLLHMIFRNS